MDDHTKLEIESMRYFHVNYISRTSFFAQIIQAISATKKNFAPDWPTEYALGISTKFEILKYLLECHRSDLKEIDSHLSRMKDADKYIASQGHIAAAYPLPLDLSFKTVAHLESFISEAFAAWDVALAFAASVCRHIVQRQVTTKEILRQLASNKAPWLEIRDKLRNFLTHRGSIWIAIEVVGDRPRQYQLVVLLRNTKDLSDQRDWIAWQELKGIVPV